MSTPTKARKETLYLKIAALLKKESGRLSTGDIAEKSGIAFRSCGETLNKMRIAGWVSNANRPGVEGSWLITDKGKASAEQGLAITLQQLGRPPQVNKRALPGPVNKRLGFISHRWLYAAPAGVARGVG